MKTWSIRTRLTIWNGLTTVAILLGFGLASYALMARTLMSRTDDMLDFEFRETLEQARKLNGGLKSGGIPEAFLEAFLLRITDARGRVVLESPKLVGHPTTIPSSTVVATEPSYFSADIDDLGRHRFVVGRDGDAPSARHVLIAVPLKEYDRELADFRDALLLVAPIGILAALIGGYYSAGRALRPVHEMTQSARNISLQNLGKRLETGNSLDELGRLAATLNLVFDRLEGSLDSMRRFTADASHELMTPLSTIRVEAEVMLQSARSPEEYRGTLHSIVEEVGRLTRLAGRLLQLARADSGTTAARSDVDLAETLHNAVGTIRPQAERAGIALSVEPLADAVVVADHDQLRQVFDNLLDNAVKYSRPSGQVTVRSNRDGNDIIVEIIDGGVGISDEALPHVFDRFFCVDPSRNRARGGAGLGLSIAKSLVESLGGRIDAESRLGAGSTFRVTLPAKG